MPKTVGAIREVAVERRPPHEASRPFLQKSARTTKLTLGLFQETNGSNLTHKTKTPKSVGESREVAIKHASNEGRPWDLATRNLKS